jgi:DNA-directed RNA polymerase alpha subunit
MVSKEDYLKALSIVNRYLNENPSELEMPRYKYTKETKIFDVINSVRLLNCLKVFLYDIRRKQVCEISSFQLPISYFENVSRKEILGTRNFGAKSIAELEEILFEAGVKMKE